MKKLFYIPSIVVLSAMLAACSGAPNPVPRGYSSYKEPYKSAPGEKASNIGYEFSADKNQSVLEDIRYAAQDLAERLDERLAFDTDTVYLSTAADNVFYKSLDHLLRSELTHRGYTLAVTPGNHPTIDIGVLDDVKPCKDRYLAKTEEGTEYRTAFIQLKVSQDGSQETEMVDGFYEVPLYGYKPSNSYEVTPPNCRFENKVTDKIEPPEAVEAIKLTK